jgi:hypothetical protein
MMFAYTALCMIMHTMSKRMRALSRLDRDGKVAICIASVIETCREDGWSSFKKAHKAFGAWRRSLNFMVASMASTIFSAASGTQVLARDLTEQTRGARMANTCACTSSKGESNSHSPAPTQTQRHSRTHPHTPRTQRTTTSTSENTQQAPRHTPNLCSRHVRPLSK